MTSILLARPNSTPFRPSIRDSPSSLWYRRDQQGRTRIQIVNGASGPDANTLYDVGDGSFTVEDWLGGEVIEKNTPNAGDDMETADISWISGNIIVDHGMWGGSDADWGITIADGFSRFRTGRGERPAVRQDVSESQAGYPVRHAYCVLQQQSVAAVAARIRQMGGCPEHALLPRTSRPAHRPVMQGPMQRRTWGLVRRRATGGSS